MAHVTALAQHILSLEPDKDAARLCFYHYLKNLCDAAETVNSELLNRFYSRALSFSHWQAEKNHLFQEVSAILQHYQESTGQALPLEDLLGPGDLQVVPIENLKTLEQSLSRFFEKHSVSFDQFRVINDGQASAIALILLRDRSVRVSVFSKFLAIRSGELTPLSMDFTLFYTSSLKLQPHVIQNIELGAHTSARFHVNRESAGSQRTSDGVYGTIVRGYTFQRIAQLEGEGLHRYPMLFYPLKRLEQFFVHRKTDPMYVELVGLLEKALDLFSSHHPEALKFGEAAFERGRLALEHIFPDDKLVRLLINNLDKTLALEYANAQLHRPTSAPNIAPATELATPLHGYNEINELTPVSKDELWAKTPDLTR